MLASYGSGRRWCPVTPRGGQEQEGCGAVMSDSGDGRDQETVAARSRRQLLKWFAAGGGAAAASLALSACKGAHDTASSGGGSTGVAGDFPKPPHKFRFVFINHVTTNSFFVPTKNGISDAAALFNVGYQWTGAEDGNVSTMASAMDTAISGGADGIAIALTDNNAFKDGCKRAFAKGIPVIAYNATAAGNYALCYVGQDLFRSGYLMGQRIVSEVKSGDVLVGISQPGGNNVQPRLDGINKAISDAGARITVRSVNSGAAQAGELNAMEAAYAGHRSVKGVYAVDAGTTAGIAQMIEKQNLKGRFHAGGYDTLTDTLNGVKSGALDFTIDQSAYLQGFLPMLYLYLYRISGTLVHPPETDTGLTFVTSDNIDSYTRSTSWYEGASGNHLGTMPSSLPLPPPLTVSQS
jgi:simple sugar transport system substrate-binding protein